PAGPPVVAAVAGGPGRVHAAAGEDPGAEDVAAEHADRTEHEQPQDGEESEPQDRDHELREIAHPSPESAPVQNRMRVRPIVRVLPSTRVAASTWWPST